MARLAKYYCWYRVIHLVLDRGVKMKNTDVCPICEEGTLHAHVGSNMVEYKGHEKQLPLHYSECDCCCSEITGAAQSRTNKRLMTEFKKQINGLLTGHELRELRLSLGMTQADAAKVFGGGPVAFAKYEADDVTQSEAMDKLLRIAQAVPSALSCIAGKENRPIAELEHEKHCQSDWLTLAGVKSLSKPLRRKTSLHVLSSNNISKGEAYGQLRVTA